MDYSSATGVGGGIVGTAVACRLSQVHLLNAPSPAATASLEIAASIIEPSRAA